ncbi:MAG: hypothetical protein J6M60_00445 [Clostridia bacterium]|nr:hypothetical protein [Clostridia bacterium]
MRGKKRFLSLILSFVLCFSMSSNAFAADIDNEIINAEDDTTGSLDSVDLDLDPEPEDPVVMGSLSGYASYNFVYGNSESNGFFNIQVNGSWSPFAGWTVKTSFNENEAANIYVFLLRPDGSQIGSTIYLDPTDEVTNQLLLNVPVGTYTVGYHVNSIGNGTIEVWVY